MVSHAHTSMQVKRGISVILLICFTLSVTGIVHAEGDFDLNTLLLKIALHEGESVNRSITISSTSGGAFDLQTIGVAGVTLGETRFLLQPGESKSIIVTFDASAVKPGVYAGSIKVKSGQKTSLLPVVFEIKSKDVFFDLNVDIPPQYATISPGQKVVAQVKIFDLTSGGTTPGLGPTAVDVEYYVYDIEGNVASSETKTVVVDKQTQLTQSLNFPAGAKTGEYVFFALVRYKSSVGVSGHLFTVAPAPQEAKKFLSNDIDLKFFAVLAVIILFFFGMIFFFVYLLHDRDNLILDLRRYNGSELKTQRQFLAAQGKIAKSKGKLEHEIKKEIQQKLSALKQKHRERLITFKKLQKKGKVMAMKTQLAMWKRAGYSTLPLEYKLKGLSAKEMASLLASWKHKYGGERRV